MNPRGHVELHVCAACTCTRVHRARVSLHLHAPIAHMHPHMCVPHGVCVHSVRVHRAAGVPEHAGCILHRVYLHNPLCAQIPCTPASPHVCASRCACAQRVCMEQQRCRSVQGASCRVCACTALCAHAPLAHVHRDTLAACVCTVRVFAAKCTRVSVRVQGCAHVLQMCGGSCTRAAAGMWMCMCARRTCGRAAPGCVCTRAQALLKAPG